MPVQKPRLVNRGGFGLLNKVKRPPEAEQPPNGEPKAEVNGLIEPCEERFAEELLPLLRDINSLQLDPDNARLHPERNMEAIRQSLRAYGQMSPVTVRRGTMVVMKGNGTVEAARGLGWTQIAAILVDMDDHEAMAYAIADNRTAELATWNKEILMCQMKLLDALKSDLPGWTKDEIEVARMAEWVPPVIEDDTGQYDLTVLTLKFEGEEMALILKAAEEVQHSYPSMNNRECMVQVCKEWLEREAEDVP